MGYCKSDLNPRNQDSVSLEADEKEREYYNTIGKHTIICSPFLLPFVDGDGLLFEQTTPRSPNPRSARTGARGETQPG